MLSTLKPLAEKPLQPFVKLFINVSPNLITLLGLIFPIAFFMTVISGHYVWALVFLALSALDMLDGMVARAHGKVTAFGGFLDSTIDRFADFVIIAAFGFAHLVNWQIVLTLILLSFMISYIRSRTELAAKGKLVASVGIIERTERLIGVGLGLLFFMLFKTTVIYGQNLLAVSLLILAALSLVTVLQRIFFAYKNL